MKNWSFLDIMEGVAYAIVLFVVVVPIILLTLYFYRKVSSDDYSPRGMVIYPNIVVPSPQTTHAQCVVVTLKQHECVQISYESKDGGN